MYGNTALHVQGPEKIDGDHPFIQSVFRVALVAFPSAPVKLTTNSELSTKFLVGGTRRSSLQAVNLENQANIIIIGTGHDRLHLFTRDRNL